MLLMRSFFLPLNIMLETEQIRKEGEAIRQEVSELTATNHMLKEQAETLTEDKKPFFLCRYPLVTFCFAPCTALKSKFRKCLF